jgi:hypothetical protein
MTFSYGIWAQRTVPGGTLYRWEGDEGRDGSGFVLFDLEILTIRSSSAEGEVLGSLAVDRASGNMTAASDGVDRTKFLQVAAAIFKAYAKSGDVPASAHVYYG